MHTEFFNADGEAWPAIQREKEFYTRVMSAFAKAIPPGPEGWTQRPTNSVMAPENNRVGADKNRARAIPDKISWTALKALIRQ
jgi:hypothetical protein